MHISTVSVLFPLTACIALTFQHTTTQAHRTAKRHGRRHLPVLLPAAVGLPAPLAAAPARDVALDPAHGDFGTFLSPARFKDRWFAVLWGTAGPILRAESEPRVAPLLEGRVTRGVITKTATAAPLSGSVMEIGAGSGMWADLYKRADAVYAVEPNAAHHAALRRRAREAGLADRYVVVPRGVQELGDTPAVDCVVSLCCFCSIPDPEQNAKAVYQYLKPGGRWYVFEHVRCGRKHGAFMQAYQRFINLIWPTCLNGCSLCRDTARTLEQAGDWAHVDLAAPADEGWYTAIPHTIGILTKPGLMNA